MTYIYLYNKKHTQSKYLLLKPYPVYLRFDLRQRPSLAVASEICLTHVTR